MSAAPLQIDAQPPESEHLSAAITLIAAGLTVLGLVVVYSSTSVGIAAEAQDATLFLRKQLLWVALGCGVFVLARTTRLESLRRYAPHILIGALVLLLLVLIPGLGRKINGARRWLRLGALNGQPSELAKLALVIYVAAWASTPGHAERLRSFKGALPILGVVGLVCALVAVEPDMGTALLLGGVSAVLLVVAGMKLRHLLACALPGVLLLGVFAFSKLTYVQRRIEVFLDPASDPSGVGYQTRQALIALGSGGPTGVGLGASRQKVLFLPDVHTDFVFALVGEEMGFLGVMAVVLAFGALIIYGMKVVDRARDGFAFLLATGIVLLLGVQSLLNMAVATASIPPKGIALPFISFGGSSLLVVAAAAGLLARIAAEGREPQPLLVDESASPDEEAEEDA